MLDHPDVGASAAERPPDAWWAADPRDLLLRLGTQPNGLDADTARDRLARHGRNEIRAENGVTRLGVLLAQLRNPLLLLLVFAAVVSAIGGELADTAIVLTILAASVALGYSREYGAQAAAEKLRSRIRARATVLRGGVPTAVPVAEVVPGDVFLLAAGSLIPADGVVLEATDCHVGEAALTGESYPVPKRPGPVAASTPLARRGNCVHLGTNVRSGTARCVAVATGGRTQFGGIAARLSLRPPETEFDRGLKRFGYLLTSAMLVMVLLVFAAHALQGRPAIETLLFSIALAVGLSPELLPAILSVNLARGAEMMARHGVLVRHLNAIENLGSMDVLCTDKTGTLTEGVVKLDGAWDARGAASPLVLELVARNAAFDTGLANPLDDAILAAHRPDLTGVDKCAEVPFDFVRKRVSVVLRDAAGTRLVTKGAVRHVVAACTRLDDGTPLDDAARAALEHLHEQWSANGVRVIAVATRELAPVGTYGRDDERELAFAGFATFLDRPKEGAAQAIADLGRLGVAVKLITGDAKLVAMHVARLVGMSTERVLTGPELDDLHDEALWREAERTDLFVEVDPNQKERIILALKKTGHVTGFLGDGINDAPAMHAADTSLSAEEAVDVAREAADFVLLERNLDVIRRGIEEGRKTFANTLKYVLTTESANLGNMVSMAAASLFLPFLPLVAGQILLNNFLSDIPAVGLADDAVDPELVERPRRWDMRFIGRFMVEFGLLSSAFDVATFLVLLFVFSATPETFRTGWFVESLLTELAIALVVRTRRPFWRSRPGMLLLLSTCVLIALTVAIPFLPHADWMGFVPLPPALVATILAITACYVAAAEATKHWFYRNGDLPSPGLARAVRAFARHRAGRPHAHR